MGVMGYRCVVSGLRAPLCSAKKRCKENREEEEEGMWFRRLICRGLAVLGPLRTRQSDMNIISDAEAHLPPLLPSPSSPSEQRGQGAGLQRLTAPLNTVIV